MDPCSFHSHIDAFEVASGPESYRLFAFYHPQYQIECGFYEDDRYSSIVFDECECSGESAFHPTTSGSLTGFDPDRSQLVPFEHGQFPPRHETTIPPEKMSSYSELMPHVVVRETTQSLKTNVATKSQPCVSPALCQGHADLPECSEIDDELDCPGEPAADFEAEPSYEEESEERSCSPPPPSPFSSCSGISEPPSPPGVVRRSRSKNRYSPMETAPSSRKGKSVAKRVSCGSGDDEPKKPRKRREAVSLACYFCRKRKIACRQPPPDSPDRTCSQCKARGMECHYPTESRRGARRGSACSRDKHA